MNVLRRMFDFNREGKLNAFERAMEHKFLLDLSRKEEVFSELEFAGVDSEELEFMDEDERREILEEAGLDPNDFDF